MHVVVDSRYRWRRSRRSRRMIHPDARKFSLQLIHD
jgi:hypothetical protein